MNPIAAILLVLALLGSLFAIAHTLNLGCEGSRKLVHLGMGTVCLSFPWLFHEAWPVDLLAALALASLLILRNLKCRLRDVLYRVNRISFGELLFPVGVALVFRLTLHDLPGYLASVGILTFADTAGALIGKRFGKHPYHTGAGQKSIEGTLAVFLVSFLITLFLPLHQDPITSFFFAIVTSLVVAMAEGILGAGLDNLILPLVVYGLLLFLRELTWPELFARTTVIVALASILYLLRRITCFSGGALLSITTLGYLCFALGGSVSLIILLAIVSLYLFTRPQDHANSR
ncbi:hypothetical protein V2O64_04600 [Verrucomicrobiaceae bacterium 227]